MSPGKPLEQQQVVIFGLGLMGGSLALRLRGHCAEVIGVDPDAAACQLALRRGAVDRAVVAPAALELQAEREARLVILAAPVGAILQLLADLPALIPGPAAVLDLGSTKAQIVEAMQALPERFDPLGGHPMCGKETGGMANAASDLYVGARFALTPLERTSQQMRSLALEVVQVLGAQPVWLDAETHDRWVAASSHLPFLAANALAADTPLEAAALIGPGFRSTARLAPTPLSMMMDVLLSNRERLLPEMRRLQARLSALQAALEAADRAQLQELLTEGAERYRALVAPPER